MGVEVLWRRSQKESQDFDNSVRMGVGLIDRCDETRSPKLLPNWRGPNLITRVVSDVTVRITNPIADRPSRKVNVRRVHICGRR